MCNHTSTTTDLSTYPLKTCTRCKKSLPIIQYSANYSARDGLTNWCKPCVRLYQKERRESRKELLSTQGEQRKRNLEIIRSHDSYQVQHRRMLAAKRYARMKKNGGKYTHEQFVDLCGDYNWQCLRCKSYTTKLQADHVIPVLHGGSSDISNIQPLCKECNRWKFAKHIDFRAESQS